MPKPPKEVIAPSHESLRAEFKEEVPADPAYGEARLWIVARDPRSLFSYWEFRPSEHPEAVNAEGIARFLLRIFRADGSEEAIVEIQPEAGNWFVPVSRSDCVYFAELGFFSNGVWCFMARSSVARTPPDAISDEGPESFATIPARVSFQRMRELLALSAVPGEGIARTAARIQSAAQAQGEWTKEQQQLLEKFFASEMEKSPDSPGSSASLIQRIRHRLSAAEEAAGPTGPLPLSREEFSPGSPGSNWPTSPRAGR